MDNYNTIIAIDLGSSRITMMAAEVSEDDCVHILGAEETLRTDLIHNGIIENTSGTAFEISNLAKRLKNSAHLPNEVKSIFVSVNGKTMKAMKARAERSFRNSTEITEQILLEMEDECCAGFRQDDVHIYDRIPLSYTIGSEVLDNPVGKKAYDLEAQYNVVAGNKRIAERIIESFDRTGIKEESYMSLGAEALAEAVLTHQECEDGVALINLGATTTTLAIYTKGALRELRIIPLGSRTITKDIQEIGISEKYAEKLKIKIGTTLESLVTQPSNIKVPNANAENEDLLINTSFLATIIEARLDEITEPILKTIDRYKKELGAGIMLSGGGAAQNNIVEYFENRTEMYVQISNHTAHLTADTDEKYFHPMFAQLIGTVLLANANQKENPVEIKTEEPKKTPKLIQRVKQTIENLSINFFETDNKM